MHKDNAIHAWRLEVKGEPAWPENVVPAKGAAGDGLERLKQPPPPPKK